MLELQMGMNLNYVHAVLYKLTKLNLFIQNCKVFDIEKLKEYRQTDKFSEKDLETEVEQNEEGPKQNIMYKSSKKKNINLRDCKENSKGKKNEVRQKYSQSLFATFDSDVLRADVITVLPQSFDPYEHPLMWCLFQRVNL